MGKSIEFGSIDPAIFPISFGRRPRLARSGMGLKLGCLASTVADVYRLVDRLANGRLGFFGLVLSLIGNRQHRETAKILDRESETETPVSAANRPFGSADLPSEVFHFERH
jgi:hypothetical protein